MLSLIIISLCMLGNFSCFFAVCSFLSKLTFSKKFQHVQDNTISVSNSLDPGQDRRSVGHDLGPNCLQMLSSASLERFKTKINAGNSLERVH